MGATTIRRVRRLLDDAGVSLARAHVLALCSGGADSVALTWLLAQLPRGAAPARLEVLHLNHGLRPVDAPAEHAAAAAAATAAGTAPLHVRTHPNPAALRSDPAGIEAAARAWRHEVAREVALELGCNVITTGHTASDQLETALLSLVGVTAVPGELTTMPVARPLDAPDPSLTLVRPLLALTRAAVEQTCRDAGLAWADDSTNADPDAHLRNAVRHRVVPALLDVAPGAGAALVRAGARSRARSEVTDALTDALLDAWTDAGEQPADLLDLRRIATLPRAARSALLARWLVRAGLGRAVSTRTVAAVEQLATAPARAACARVDLAGGACVRRDGYHLTLTRAPAAPEGTHHDHA